MIREYRFYNENSRWFIDIPEWTGSKADLEMVAGADDFLDMLADKETEVKLILSDEEFTGAHVLDILDCENKFHSGAYYIVRDFKKNPVNLKMWLCDVTKFVFGGKFPEEIFYKVSSN